MTLSPVNSDVGFEPIRESLLFNLFKLTYELMRDVRTTVFYTGPISVGRKNPTT